MHWQVQSMWGIPFSFYFNNNNPAYCPRGSISISLPFPSLSFPFLHWGFFFYGATNANKNGKTMQPALLHIENFRIGQNVHWQCEKWHGITNVRWLKKWFKCQYSPMPLQKQNWHWWCQSTVGIAMWLHCQCYVFKETCCEKNPATAMQSVLLQWVYGWNQCHFFWYWLRSIADWVFFP